MTYRSSSSKIKVTATLDPELVKAIDESIEKATARSRSQLIEEILRDWQTAQQRREIERQVEDYYRSLSTAEQDEDKEWSRIPSRAARDLWED